MSTPSEQQKAPETLTGSGIGDKVSDKLGIVKKHTRPVVAAAIDAIREQLEAGGRVTLHGLGTFTLRVRRGRIAHNPMAPDRKVEMPKHNIIWFKPAKKVKAAVLKLPPGICPKGQCNYAGKQPCVIRKKAEQAQISSSSAP